MVICNWFVVILFVVAGILGLLIENLNVMDDLTIYTDARGDWQQ